MKKTTAQPPEEFTGIEVTPPPSSAAGFQSITSSLQHIRSEMSLARGIKLLNRLNQKGGFDCPGCAWPDPDEKRAFLAEYCENGAKAIAEEATQKRVTPEFFEKHSIEALSKQSDYWLGKQGRLTHPMILKPGSQHYEPISWEESFELIAKDLNGLDSPNEAIFYTSGRTSNETAFLYQLFVRQFGTNNLPDCSNMCHESSGSALSETVGIGKGSVTLKDFELADLVIVIGQNPGTNHPRMLSALKKTKKNGGKIITINPLPEAGLMQFKDPQRVLDWFGSGTQLTDLFLPVTINGDVALLKAIMKLMLEKELEAPGTIFDQAFIKAQTKGYKDFIEDLQKHELKELIEASGVSEDDIREAAAMIINHDKIITCWAMGLTQHPNGVQNIREVVNLLLIKGSIGKPGAGTCPVRGHSNVQGDRTMGIWEKPKEAFLKKLDKTFKFTAPRKHGYDVVAAIKAMHEGKAKTFFAMGGNFLSATPDTEFTADALRNCQLTVQVSTKLNRSHLIHGKTALILPCLGRSELDIKKGEAQIQSVENSMGVVHSTKGDLIPASRHLLSEPDIVVRLAKATLGDETKVKWDSMVEDYDNIRKVIAKVVPGFRGYNKRVREPGGFHLPNNAREGDFSPTATGKANFTINPVPNNTLEDGHYWMMTIRSHDQYNTTIYGLDDRYRGIYNERRVVLMNSDDMDKAGLKEKDVVHLISHFQGERREAHNFLVIPYPIPPKCTATYFPEANVLVPINSKAERSNTPASKRVNITIEKAK